MKKVPGAQTSLLKLLHLQKNIFTCIIQSKRILSLKDLVTQAIDCTRLLHFCWDWKFSICSDMQVNLLWFSRQNASRLNKPWQWMLLHWTSKLLLKTGNRDSFLGGFGRNYINLALTVQSMPRKIFSISTTISMKLQGSKFDRLNVTSIVFMTLKC